MPALLLVALPSSTSEDIRLQRRSKIRVTVIPVQLHLTRGAPARLSFGNSRLGGTGNRY